MANEFFKSFRIFYENELQLKYEHHGLHATLRDLNITVDDGIIYIYNIYINRLYIYTYIYRKRNIYIYIYIKLAFWHLCKICSKNTQIPDQELTFVDRKQDRQKNRCI